MSKQDGKDKLIDEIMEANPPWAMLGLVVAIWSVIGYLGFWALSGFLWFFLKVFLTFIGCVTIGLPFFLVGFFVNRVYYRAFEMKTLEEWAAKARAGKRAGCAFGKIFGAVFLFVTVYITAIATKQNAKIGEGGFLKSAEKFGGAVALGFVSHYHDFGGFSVVTLGEGDNAHLKSIGAFGGVCLVSDD